MTDQTGNGQTITRRRMLSCLGVMGASAVFCAATAGGIGVATGFFDRIAGVTHTELLADAAWTYGDNALAVDLTLTDLLHTAGTAARIEGESLPNRVLLIHALDGAFYAYKNECPHAGRHIDLQADGTLQCTSVGASTFELDGDVISGEAPSPLVVYPVELDGDQVVVHLA